MKRFLSVSLLIVLACFCSCIAVNRNVSEGTATIPVEHERLYLAPLQNDISLENLRFWPQDPDKQKILLKNFSSIWEKLKREFKRCEKFGLYKMVEDTEHPTVRISVTLISAEEGDTLFIPVRLEIERLSDRHHSIYTVPANATAAVSKKEKNPFGYMNKLFSNYRRNFPYIQIVSFFYPHFP